MKKQLALFLVLSISLLVSACGPDDHAGDVQGDVAAETPDSTANALAPWCQGAYYCVGSTGSRLYFYVYGEYNTMAKQNSACTSAINHGSCSGPASATGCPFLRDAFPPDPRPCKIK